MSAGAMGGACFRSCCGVLFKWQKEPSGILVTWGECQEHHLITTQPWKSPYSTGQGPLCIPQEVLTVVLLAWKTSGTHGHTTVSRPLKFPKSLGTFVKSVLTLWAVGFQRGALKAATPEGLNFDGADPQVLTWLYHPLFWDANTMLIYYTLFFICNLWQDDIFWDMRYFL